MDVIRLGNGFENIGRRRGYHKSNWRNKSGFLLRIWAILLFNSPSSRKASLNEWGQALESCSTTQLRVITNIAKATKIALEKYQENHDGRL